ASFSWASSYQWVTARRLPESGVRPDRSMTRHVRVSVAARTARSDGRDTAFPERGSASATTAAGPLAGAGSAGQVQAEVPCGIVEADVLDEAAGQRGVIGHLAPLD